VVGHGKYPEGARVRPDRPRNSRGLMGFRDTQIFLALVAWRRNRLRPRRRPPAR
jgi:hypothetical protein